MSGKLEQEIAAAQAKLGVAESKVVTWIRANALKAVAAAAVVGLAVGLLV